MSYQFAHLDCFSRKGNDAGQTVDFILAELGRERASATRHIVQPKPPSVVYGKTVAEVRALHDQRVKAARSTNVKGQERRIRVDQDTLAVAVVSHPGKDATTDVAGVEEWQAGVIAWAKRQYGDALVSVVRHDDESHPHLHCVVLPTAPDMKASAFHSGKVAKDAVIEKHGGKKVVGALGADQRKEINREGDRAYREAMREWQTEHWQEVSAPLGLARFGPNRRRLTRSAWRDEQRSYEFLRRVERLNAEASGFNPLKKGRVVEKEVVREVENRVKAKEIDLTNQKNRDVAAVTSLGKTYQKKSMEDRKKLEISAGEIASRDQTIQELSDRNREMDEENTATSQKFDRVTSELLRKTSDLEHAPAGFMLAAMETFSEDQQVEYFGKIRDENPSLWEIVRDFLEKIGAAVLPRLDQEPTPDQPEMQRDGQRAAVMRTPSRGF